MGQLRVGADYGQRERDRQRYRSGLRDLVHRRDGEEPAEREAPGNEGQREALRHAFFPVVFFPVQGKKPTAERLYAAQVVPRTKTDSLSIYICVLLFKIIYESYTISFP